MKSRTLISAFLLATAAALSLGSASVLQPAPTRAPTGAQSSGPAFMAQIGYRAVEPRVAARRMTSNQPLAIVLAPEVLDVFTTRPLDGFQHDYREHRRTVGEALRKSFAPNFASVSFAEGESKQGLELLVQRAEVLTTHTIKFHVILVRDGKELVDTIGETEGMTISSSAPYEEQRRKYPEMVGKLYDLAIREMCEAVYDGVMRDAQVESADFWATR